LSKLRGRLFTIFTAYRVRISGMFLQLMCLRSIPGVVVSTEACGPYSNPDSQCLECYIYRLSTLDTIAKDRSWYNKSYYRQPV